MIKMMMMILKYALMPSLISGTIFFFIAKSISTEKEKNEYDESVVGILTLIAFFVLIIFAAYFLFLIIFLYSNPMILFLTITLFLITFYVSCILGEKSGKIKL